MTKLSYHQIRDDFIKTVYKVKFKKKDKQLVNTELCGLNNGQVELSAKTSNNRYVMLYRSSFDNFDLCIYDKNNTLVNRVITNDFTDILLQIEKN